MGDSTNGSQRWLALGPARFQPSELVKVAIPPMMIAWMLVVDPGRPNLKKIILCLIVTAIPAGLIFIQPDLDGAIFTVTYALFVLYFSGMSWKIISSFLAIIATTIPMLWFFVMAAYQKKRVTQFLNPESDPLAQVIRSFSHSSLLAPEVSRGGKAGQTPPKATLASFRKVTLTLSFPPMPKSGDF